MSSMARPWIIEKEADAGSSLWVGKDGTSRTLMIVERKDPAAAVDFYIFSRFRPRHASLLLIAGNNLSRIFLSRMTMNGVKCLSFRARSRLDIPLSLRSAE